MDTELIITLVGLAVAGLAAVIGIWVERDEKKPPRYAYALSGLIGLATIVSMYQAYEDSQQSEKLEGDLARMLEMMEKVASNSDVEIPELSQFVQTEIAAQNRANPGVVQKFAQRVSDDGGDPKAVLARNLPPADVESMGRGGALTKIKPAAMTAAKAAGSAGGPASPPRFVIRPRGAASAAAADPTVAAAPTAAPTAEPSSAPTVELAPSAMPRAKMNLGGKGAATADAAAAKAPAAAPAKTGAPKAMGAGMKK